MIGTGFQVYFAWRGPAPSDPPAVQAATGHPIGGLILVAGLFILAGLLNSAPVLRRLLPTKKIDTPTLPALSIESAKLAPYVGLQRRVFVVSHGCALQMSRNGVGVLLQIFTSEAAKLTYIKVILLRFPEWKLELESSEPTPLGAMELSPKRIERDNLTPEQLEIIQEGVVINGYVRLEYGEEHQVVQFSLTNQPFLQSSQPKPVQALSLKQRVANLANELIELLRRQGPQPPSPLDLPISERNTEAKQRAAMNAYFNWQSSTYYNYMAFFRDRVVNIDFELAAAGVMTKLTRPEIDPPSHGSMENHEIDVKKIAETLLLTASHMPN